MSELLYSPATYGVDFSSKTALRPRARQAPMMAVVKNSLWLLGGIVEVSQIFVQRASHLGVQIYDSAYCHLDG